MELKEIKEGSLVGIETTEGAYRGILMPRSELADKGHLVIKLDNGYNIGIEKSKITQIELIEKKREKEEIELKKAVSDPEKVNVSILATGGTIASKVDYVTGGVHSAFSADELISAVPELQGIANISGKQVFNKFSENVNPGDWVKIARAVYDEVKNGACGVVVTHGTDTMGYTSAALSFMLKTPAPVILTGAQRSSDRGSSDAAMDLICAAQFAAKADFAGVFVVMHGEPSDSYCLIHPGTRVRKLHSSRRDAFKTVNDKPLGKADVNGNIEYLKDSNSYRFFIEKNKKDRLELDTKLEEKAALIKYFPGLNPEMISYLVNAGYKGIVLEGTGLGHVNENLFKSIKQAIDSGVTVAMTSQTIFGRVNMRVYATGRNLLNAGVIPCEDMLPETALVKLMWVLGHTNKAEKAREMMLTNYAGEITKRTTVE
ncbi:MAG: glutamyl-tRNA(Gln) amidotransferase subunit D [Candidatus Altiarchaeales archaeon WOR_SM1_86-2]|nr:MAG: glutamyl-tRNA(Gln) amidotransferase subunit D [Candidatus Altiarchaeales archaeon WOR_SM1_86-2]